MFSPATILVLVVALVLGALYSPTASNSQFATQHNGTANPAKMAHRALLVTAHPDDEAMFFAPTILALNTPASPVDLFHLCISTGNADGLGSVRREELNVALDVLRFSRNKRWIVDRPDLQDDITLSWDPDLIAKVLRPYVIDLKIDTILTFDKKGVSSHPNHASIPAGAQNLIASLVQSKAATIPRLYTLQTVPTYAKYFSFAAPVLAKMSLVGYRILSGYERFVIRVAANFIPVLQENGPFPLQPDANLNPMFVSNFGRYLSAFSAMRAHDSQMVWFRWFYVAFSEYMWVNNWKAELK